MRRMVLVSCLVLAAAGGLGWGDRGSGPGVAHAAPACTKVNLCLSAQSDGHTWWIVLGGQHLQSGTYVTYSYATTTGGSFGAVLVSSNNGSLNDTIQGGPCPAGFVNASASGTTSKGGTATATLSNAAPC